MEPSSQDPKTTPEQPLVEQVDEQIAASDHSASTPLARKKRGKKPVTVTLIILFLLALGVLGAWFWLNSQTQNDQKAADLPSTAPQSQNVPKPYTVAYAFRDGSQTSPSGLFWRPAEGGEKQTAPQKAYIGSSLVYGNQVVIETYGTEQAATSILYSNDGGKNYTTIFTGKKPASINELGDQVTGIVFASDGKSVVFGFLSDSRKNTVKRIFFDKPAEVVDVMNSDAAGVFPIAFNAKTQKFFFSEGCYNCDGNSSPTVLTYNVSTKKRSTLINGTDKHLTFTANKSATRLLVTTPTVDKTKTVEDSFFGYYVGAPYSFSLFDLEANKSIDPAVTVGSEAENAYVRGGFMADDSTAYYYGGKQLFVLGKSTPSLLYEAGQPIHEVFYVSPTTVFASTGDYQNFTLSKFGIKTQETKQLLTGDDVSTRVFGVTLN